MVIFIHGLSHKGSLIGEGKLPPKQMKLVLAWAEIHKDDLLADWELASKGELPFKIEPLK